MTNAPRLANIDGNLVPILMVNSLYDPSTSYIWAEGCRQQVGNAVLLGRDGDGHTSYSLAGEASRIIDRYLVTLELPAHGTVVQT